VVEIYCVGPPKSFSLMMVSTKGNVFSDI